ncbi:MAG: hypothetical protein ACNA8R_05075 [Nitriliruptoraceae bacterium]
MSIDDTTIRELLALDDEHGVLSFYAGHVPAQAADRQPTAPIELRNQLKALRSRLEGADRDLVRAIESRLARLDGPLEALVDPKRPGQGRALFVGVASGEQRSVSLQLPFRERVLHDSTAYVRPLVTALDEGRPALIVVVSRTGVRVLHWATGEAAEVEEARFVKDEDLFRDDASGPSTSNPQRAMYARSDREGYEERLDEHRRRFLKQVLEDVVHRAASDRIDRMVLSAPPKLREEVKTLVPAHEGVRVLVADQVWESAPAHEIAQHAFQLLRSVHLDREQELADHVLERALSGGPGALGLRHVCEALNAGRVDHLLIDDRLVLDGYVASDGTLHPRIEGLAASAEDLTFARDRLFVERMIERALATSARITPLAPAPADRLADHEGVAALLRW